MRFPRMQLLLPALLGCALYSGAIGAQPAPPQQKLLSLTQAERLAVDLRQGMTLQEVRGLLGKPKRTAMKALGYGPPSDAGQSALQWTYAWSSASQSEATLSVVFASHNAPERWLVQSWDWTAY